MEGFFRIEQTQSKSISKKGKRHTCISCGLFKTAKNPKINVRGGGAKRILILGTSPSDVEDRKGKVFADNESNYLINLLEEFGIDIEEDCWTLAAVRCKTTTKDGEYRHPVMKEVLSCRRLVLQSIAEVKPHIVILMGLTAVNSVIGHITGEGYDSLDKFRGYQIPDQTLKTFLCPMQHPRDLRTKAMETIFAQDLKAALKLTKKAFPAHPGTPSNVRIIDNEEGIYKLLKRVLKQPEIAWDIEATGLKPHDTSKHKIACLSLCFEKDKSYCIPMLDISERNLKLLRKIFGGTKVGKIAQNMKYEHTWFLNLLGIEIKGWIHDTMQATHIQNNCPGVTGLKFQTYVQFGVVGYEDSSQKYIKAEYPNNTNNVVEAMNQPQTKKDLMTYCGLDSLYTYLLWERQEQQMEERRAYTLMHDGVLALQRAEQKGMQVDVGYLEKQKKVLENEIRQKQQVVEESKLVRRWKHVYGNRFNLGSGQQLGRMLYRELKLDPPKLTPSGQGAVDDEALKQLNLPELNSLLEIRKLEKAKSTYIEGFLREQVNGIIHPFFNLHSTRTFRSSSDAPNFQNIPKRDKLVKKLVRSAIKPSPGNLLMEADFSKLEVSIAACYHKDPKMLEYLTSDKNDMHGDLAKQIFKIDNFDHHKYESHAILRAAAKNGFVFPQFYGDYYGNNAKGLCQWIGLPQGKWKKGKGMKMEDGYISDHLISNGITGFVAFMDHLKEIEEDFWGNRFKKYAQWKDKWLKEYERNGYFRSKTGFTYKGIMGKNDVINYPVQGAAFHCLLWSFIEIDRISREEGWNTRLIGQIHDAVVLDVDPAELFHVSRTLKRIMTEKLKEVWDWIIVPLQVEIEISGVDESWAVMDELEPWEFQ